MTYDICIIGAGQSGLTTCKTFVEKSYNVIVLEKCDNCNGMFSTIQEKSYFYWSTSRYMSGFSDFPINKNIPTWFTIQQYINYLNSYKKHFGLDNYIQYSSNVIKCYQNEYDEWIVTYINTKNNFKNTLICKKLIICSGLNQTPKFPEIIDNYTGEIIHTEQIYRNMNKIDWQNNFENKKILLLGGGESAFDIGHLLTKYTDKLYYTTKNYVEWFYPGAENERNKKRLDKINSECLNKKVFKTLDYPTDTQLPYIEYSLPEPASEFWHSYSRYILSMYGTFVNKETSEKCTKINCIHSHEKLCKINETPDNLFKKYVVKRTDFILDIHENKVDVIYFPEKIEGRTVYTKEETIHDVDIIVCASGFKKEFSFLDKNVYSGDFIKKIIPVNTSNIAFIGFARPTMGSIAVIAEMQSWWTEMYFNNSLKYTIREPVFRNWNVLDLSNDHINTIVIGCFYLRDLARDMNIEPNLIHLFFTDFELFKTIYTGSCHTMVYRINGIKSYPGSRDVLINTFPKFEEHSIRSKRYILHFILYHIFFIIFCILISFALTYCVYFISKLNNNKLKFSSFTKIFYMLSISIIFIFYKYL